MSSDSAHLGINWTSECSVCNMGGQGVMFDIFQFFSLSQRIGRVVQTDILRDQLKSPYLCKSCLEKLEIIEKFEDMRKTFTDGFLRNYSKTPVTKRPDNSTTPATKRPDNSTTPATKRPDNSTTPATKRPDNSTTPATKRPDNSTTPATKRPDNSTTLAANDSDDDCSIIPLNEVGKISRKVKLLDEKLSDVRFVSVPAVAKRKVQSPAAPVAAITRRQASVTPTTRPITTDRRPSRPNPTIQSENQGHDGHNDQNARTELSCNRLLADVRRSASPAGSSQADTVESDRTLLMYPSDNESSPDTAALWEPKTVDRSTSPYEQYPDTVTPQLKRVKIETDSGDMVDSYIREAVDFPMTCAKEETDATEPEPRHTEVVRQIKIEDCRTVRQQFIDLTEDDDTPVFVKMEYLSDYQPHCSESNLANNAMLETVVESFLNWDTSQPEQSPPSPPAIRSPPSPQQQPLISDSRSDVALQKGHPKASHSANVEAQRTTFQASGSPQPRSPLTESPRGDTGMTSRRREIEEPTGTTFYSNNISEQQSVNVESLRISATEEPSRIPFHAKNCTRKSLKAVLNNSSQLTTEDPPRITCPANISTHLQSDVVDVPKQAIRRQPSTRLQPEVTDSPKTKSEKSTKPVRITTALRQLLPKSSPQSPVQQRTIKVAQIRGHPVSATSDNTFTTSTQTTSQQFLNPRVTQLTNQQLVQQTSQQTAQSTNLPQGVQYLVNPMAVSGTTSFQFNDSSSLLYPMSMFNSVPDNSMAAASLQQQMIFVGGMPTFAYVAPGVGQTANVIQSLPGSGGFCMQQQLRPVGQTQKLNTGTVRRQLIAPKMPIYPVKRENL